MSETADTLKKKASKVYGQADEKTKKALAEVFGKDAFKKSIIEEVKTIKDVLRIANVKLEDILPYKKPANDDEENTNSFVIIKLINKVLNQGWVPDFKNTNQPKYYPLFEFKRSGFRFYGSSYYYRYTYTGVGSRLCYETEELSNLAGQVFLSYYEKLITK